MGTEEPRNEPSQGAGERATLWGAVQGRTGDYRLTPPDMAEDTTTLELFWTHIQRADYLSHGLN